MSFLKRFDYFLPIIFGIIISITLFLKGGWIEPDTYAFISRACGTSVFETPFLSQLFFDSIPCNEIIWFLLQGIVWTINLLIVFYFLKKNGYDSLSFFFSAFSLSVVYSLLAFEDDFLVTGILFAIMIILFNPVNNIWKNRIIYGIITLFIGLFVWKGALLIGGIILLGSIHPLLSYLLVGYYFWMNGLNDWGGSVEGIVFSGYTVLIPIVLLLFLTSKEKIFVFYREKKYLFHVFMAFVFLGFFQSKWGLYSGLLLPIVFSELVLEKHYHNILYVGLIVLLLLVPLVGITKPPHDSHWMVLRDGIVPEQNGGIIVIDHSFGLEKWGFEYIGGHPVPYGSRDGNFYIGISPSMGAGCKVLSRADLLVLEKC